MTTLLPTALVVAALLAPATDVAPFTENGYSVTPPPLEGLELVPGQNEQLRVKWSGRMGEHALVVSVFRIPVDGFGLTCPEDLLELVESNVKQGGRPFFFENSDFIEGDRGFAPYASIGWGDVRGSGGERASTLFSCVSFLQEFGYSLEVECTPPAGEKVTKELLDWFDDGVEYEGPEWDREWTDEEIEARWIAAVPDIPWEDVELVRTKHYIIVTNSSGKRLFSKKMEECYKTIRKMFPFKDFKHRRLLPVFLFRTRDQYYDFSVNVAGMSLEAARNTGGHAWRDYYSTWYEAPGDPVHIHEATHQIFGNCLRLGGAGSWFQEGVAEYVETRDNERNDAARMVKKERHRRIPDFVRVPSLIAETGDQDIKGGSEAGSLYKQAALFIEFLRESKFGKKRFDDWLHAIGRVPYNDVAAIEEVFMRVYEVSLEQVDALFVEYCEKR